MNAKFVCVKRGCREGPIDFPRSRLRYHIYSLRSFGTSSKPCWRCLLTVKCRTCSLCVHSVGTNMEAFFKHPQKKKTTHFSCRAYYRTRKTVQDSGSQSCRKSLPVGCLPSRTLSVLLRCKAPQCRHTANRFSEHIAYDSVEL